MAEEEIKTIQKIVLKLILPVLVAVIIIVAGYFAWTGLMNVPIEEEYYQQDLPTYLDYSSLGIISYDGILYPIEDYELARTNEQISDYIAQKVMYIGCEGCEQCDDSKENCQSCNVCQGLDKTISSSVNFQECESCYTGIENGCESGICCSICYDANSESLICRNLKDSIRKSYVLEREINIFDEAIPRGEKLTDATIENMINEIKLCKNEAIDITTESAVGKQLCYFDTTELTTTNPETFRKYDTIRFGKYATDLIGLSTDMQGGDTSIDISPQTLSSPPDTKYFSGTLVINISVNDLTINEDSISHSHKNIKTQVGTLMICKETENHIEDTKKHISYTYLDRDLTGIGGGKLVVRTFNIYKNTFCTLTNKNLKPCASTTDEQCLLYSSEIRAMGEEYVFTNSVFPYTSEKDTVYLTINIPDNDNIAVRSYAMYFYPDYKTFDTDTFGIDLVNPAGKITFNIDPNKLSTSKDYGRINLKLSGLRTTQQKNCEFNMYLTDSNAFANNPYETVVEIYDFFRGFYIGDVRIETRNSINAYVDSKTSYNYYEFELDREYTTGEITTAIEEGYNYWVSRNLPYYTQSILYIFNPWSAYGGMPVLNTVEESQWDIFEFMPFETSGCSIMEGTASMVGTHGTAGYNYNKKIINYYCPDEICKDTLKIKVEFILNDYGSVQPFIWFCGE